MTADLYGQHYLSIENPTRAKRVRYMPGDYIRVKMRDDKSTYSGKLHHVSDSTIVIEKKVKMGSGSSSMNRVYYDEVKLEEIGWVYRNPGDRYGEYFIPMASGGLVLSGVIFLGIGGVNRWINGQAFDIKTVAISAGLIVSGILLSRLLRKKYKLQNKWQYKTIPLN